jgi:hypothetical protein
MRQIYKSVAIFLFMFIQSSIVFAQVVVSQVYGGGGNIGATYTNDFIELFNRGATTVYLTGWSVQYASATGTGNFGGNSSMITELPNISLAPGQYLLIQEAQGSGGTSSLPTPDVTDATPIHISATGGKVALVNTTTPLGCNGSSTPCDPAALATIVDLIGWGTANFFEGSAAAPATINTTAVLRVNDGCTDTDDNAADFTTSAPNPRNTASPLHVCATPGPITGLFFSEYIEGSSYNKALEIYNGSGSAVDLAAGSYNIQMFFNGSASAGLTINLTGNVAGGDVYVVAHSSANATILAQADQTNGAGWFNGNDAVVLRKGSTILDAIGQVGFNPGTEWGTGLTSTADNTLQRKSSICSGDMDASDVFDPAVEWDGYATNSFDGLGSHTANCTIGSYDIYVVDTHSGNSEQVTFIDDADEYNPSFAPGGIFIVHDVKGGSAPLGHSIYITNISTGVSTLLAGAEGGNDASWSPDSMYIAFDRTPAGDPDVYIVPSTGGTPTLIRNNAIDAEWSNNSKRLVFQDVTDGSIRTVDLTGGSETTIVSYGINPSWSNNGKYITYSDGNNIYEIKVSEWGEPKGSPVQLTFDGTGIFNEQPSWSNNTKTVVFHSNWNTGDFDIWTVSVSGGTPSMLTGNPDYGDYDPCYSKNGKYVAYAGFTPTVFTKHNSNNKESVTTNEKSLPTKYVLEQNFPNPFNPSTVIRYALPENASVSLVIYDILGRKVAVLVDGEVGAGYHQVTFNGSKLSSGMYFYKLTAGNFTQINKMLLVK